MRDLLILARLAATGMSLSEQSLTLASGGLEGLAAGMAVSLRILSHPDMSRVGEHASLFAAHAVGELELSRNLPSFVDRDGAQRGGLGTRHVSRSALLIRRQDDGSLVLMARGEPGKVRVNGRVCASELPLPVEQLKAGTVVTLGRSVALLLGECDLKPAPALPGLDGVSSALRYMKRELAKIASFDGPLLVVGGPGSGKEAAARGLHALSARRDGPFVLVRAAEWERACARREPHEALLSLVADAAQSAPRASLFIRDLKNLNRGAQAALESVLDAPRARGEGRGDVRILAASDIDPDRPGDHAGLSSALVDRFAHRVYVPSLSARREDIALLFAEFLRVAMRAHGAEARLSARDPEPAFVPAPLVAQLMAADWPGNIRQLQGFAEAFALANHAATSDEIDAWIETDARLQRPPPSAAPPVAKAAADLSDDEIREALQSAQYNITRAAALLKVSKAWLHVRMERSGLLPKAKDLSQEAIKEALQEAGFDAVRAAKLLHVSRHGLKLRMNTLGIKLPEAGIRNR